MIAKSAKFAQTNGFPTYIINNNNQLLDARNRTKCSISSLPIMESKPKLFQFREIHWKKKTYTTIFGLGTTCQHHCTCSVRYLESTPIITNTRPESRDQLTTNNQGDLRKTLTNDLFPSAVHNPLQKLEQFKQKSSSSSSSFSSFSSSSSSSFTYLFISIFFLLHSSYDKTKWHFCRFSSFILFRKNFDSQHESNLMKFLF